ncbi:hypothetical protein GEV33_012479 [Tenebrio molitor]|uniref:Uncharacterized protein n=1 Tax=Tenebrio molitor TaxID=7067 RepID=A0A8J6H9H1_TENMO|nr:hypothetical protein GEV33_012479 [Tenebrio molitor]
MHKALQGLNYGRSDSPPPVTTPPSDVPTPMIYRVHYIKVGGDLINISGIPDETFDTSGTDGAPSDGRTPKHPSSWKLHAPTSTGKRERAHRIQKLQTLYYPVGVGSFLHKSTPTTNPPIHKSSRKQCEFGSPELSSLFAALILAFSRYLLQKIKNKSQVMRWWIPELNPSDPVSFGSGVATSAGSPPRYGRWIIDDPRP